MIAVTVLLALCALALAVVSSSGRFPLWPAVFVLALVELLQLWPG